MNNIDEWFVSSILGMDTGRALVKLETPKGSFMMSAREASNLASLLNEAAEASRQDFMLFRFLTEDMSLSVNQAGRAIEALREYRAKAEE